MNESLGEAIRRMRLTDKVAVVTGSTSGIGRACAELFAEEGARVVVNGFPPERGLQVVEAIRATGGTADYCRADVRQSDDLQRLIQFAVDTYGRLDILMNNAVCGRSAAVLEQEEGDWDEVFASSVRAAYLGSKYALPWMIRTGGGSIIHTASVHGLLGGSQGAAYDAAKAALVNLARQMAVDYGQHGIRVNALCPGRILTEGKVEWLKRRPDEARRQQWVYPLGRPGTLREIASAALFLASDESSFVTGHALVVDGGLTAQLQDAVAARVEEGLLAEQRVQEIPPRQSER
jgi:NAD(P)-dependent dehydrogenase (short-subunit alcohol dehydrogenase family)